MQEEDGAEGELDSNNNFIVQLVQAMPKLFETEAVSLKWMKVVVSNNEKNFSPIAYKLVLDEFIYFSVSVFSAVIYR